MPILDAPVVLVTGELTGIGRAAAVALAKKGAKVVVAGPRDEASEALVKELLSYGSEVEFIAADSHKEDDIPAIIDTAVARFDRRAVAPNSDVDEVSVSAEKVPHQVVDVDVRVGDGMSAIARLVYLRAPDPPAHFSSSQFSFTPLQSLRLARDFLAAAEKFIVPSAETLGVNSSRGK